MTKDKGPPTNDKGGPAGAILLPQAEPLGLKQIQARIRKQAIGLEKQIAYIKGLAIGSEAGEDLIRELDSLEKAIEEIRN